jgi:hypothetical protein
MSDMREIRDNLLCDLRQEIAQVAWAAGVQCSILQDYASLGDDRGLEYSLRQLSAYVRSAVRAFNQLHSIEVAREFEAPETIGGAQ